MPAPYRVGTPTDPAHNPLTARPVLNVAGHEVRVGDDLMCLDHAHRVVNITRYRGAEHVGCLSTADWMVAWSHEGWSMTLIPSQSYRVAR